ncbi:MAG: SAP domain-containing protein, partial [Candidatus Poseidoniaceae archaeon]|nr:SAP domain-containing protein [Candidatus Poseidoniaceae archaeon]
MSDNYEDMTVAELKVILKERKLPVSGKKADLIERLSQSSEEVVEEPVEEVVEEVITEVEETPVPAEESASFHQIIKQKFIEGGPGFMGIVLLCLIF